MAPEVIDGCYSELSDMWSCGVLLYMLMTGVAPFYKPTKA
jgi:serine/threonine protein kinase